MAGHNGMCSRFSQIPHSFNEMVAPPGTQLPSILFIILPIFVIQPIIMCHHQVQQAISPFHFSESSTMKLFQYLTIPVFVFINVFTITGFSQDHSQLRLKLGMVKNFCSPRKMSEGYAYRASTSYFPLPVLGLEYSRPLKNGNGFLFGGVSLDLQKYSGSINEMNIRLAGAGGTLGVTTGVFKLYGGIEKRFTKKNLPLHKNYFTWMGGLGITINPFSRNGEFAVADYDYVTDPSGYGNFGTTADGRQLKGTQLFLANKSPVSVALMGGLRWHIRNKRGKETLIAELLGNYGLNRYFNYEVHYRLNDQPAIDRLGYKGIYMQLNLLIPLVNFGKNKKR
jgi:hypothetical protein